MNVSNGKTSFSKSETIFGYIVFISITIFVYRVFLREEINNPDDSAFYACESQLKLIAHPAYASIPRVSGRMDGAQYYFAWPSSEGLAFGGRVVSASCFVNRQTLEITSLTVNGKEQIWRRPESP